MFICFVPAVECANNSMHKTCCIGRPFLPPMRGLLVVWITPLDTRRERVSVRVLSHASHLQTVIVMFAFFRVSAKRLQPK